MTSKRNINRSRGYTLVELLISVFVSSIVLGGVYASFTIVSRQHQKLAAFSDIQEMGIPTIRLVARDLRMAGHKALDADAESIYGTIATPITITDSGDACCDTISVVYDIDINTRYRTRYYTAPRVNPARNALYMDREQWDGMAWNMTINGSLVADYVEDFQIVGSDFSFTGFPRLLDVSIIFRNKNPVIGPLVAYTKPAYDVGNYNLTTSDNFYRDEFNATVNIRNLR